VGISLFVALRAAFACTRQKQHFRLAPADDGDEGHDVTCTRPRKTIEVSLEGRSIASLPELITALQVASNFSLDTEIRKASSATVELHFSGEMQNAHKVNEKHASMPRANPFIFGALMGLSAASSTNSQETKPFEAPAFFANPFSYGSPARPNAQQASSSKSISVGRSTGQLSEPLKIGMTSPDVHHFDEHQLKGVGDEDLYTL